MHSRVAATARTGGSTAPAGAVIELRHLSRLYTVGDSVVTALSEVNLRVMQGEFAVVLGPSGSGKTTLLNMIGALDSPSSGEVIVDGKHVEGATRAELFRYRRSSVSFVFQTFNLFPSLSALENVQFAIDLTGDGHRRISAASVLDQVGLSERLDHLPQQLSGGEQQRVAIARALATGNPVLLADEPTGELDYRTGVQILELLREQASRGTTVLVVTHNREISRSADRVLEMSSGRIVSDGPPVGGPVPMSDLRW